jgi:DNA polymerase-3 subunit alpha
MSTPSFIHLHTHSHYSLLSALPKIPELVQAAKDTGMPALALTDAGNLYGAIEFYKRCEKEDIKPIIGVDFYVALESRHDKRSGIDNRWHRMVLLAKNTQGYYNLMRLVSKSHLEGFYYKPRIDMELMGEHAEGLVCISPQFSGEIADLIAGGDVERAQARVAELRAIYSDFYLEITHHPEMEGQMERRKKIVEFARAENIPLVAAHDVYYLKPEDHRIREIMIAIGSGNTVAEDVGFMEGTPDFSFISQEQAQKYFADTPDALENTLAIAEKCTLSLELGNWVFPDFVIPEHTNYDDELRRVTYEGIEKRGLEKTQELIDRIEYELDIIKTKGYSPYFMVVSDLLTFAKENGILTNTRGSAAGSLVAYLTFITSINPLDYRLPFERFLNPERPSAPDVDMDFADNRRDEAISYARRKYGEDRVAQIGTFGTMLARGSVRDVARALGHSYNTGDMIAKLIPQGSQGFPMTIERALEEEPELKALYDDSAEAQEIIDTARKIEGCARHISIHAAGVVIAPTEMTTFTPVQYDPKGGKIITQYDMHAVEDAGLLKFDFLGITNLAMLEHAVRLVRQLHDVEVNLDTIPLDDKKTYRILWSGQTMGVFQMASTGMTRWLMELKPTNIDDINAMVALYRPGPMAFIPDYIERKADPSKVTYLDPRLKQFLEPTYGILIYQDDILLIAVNLAGYSWGEADKFRKAVGKKIPEEMAKQKKRFIEGCVEHDMTPSAAQELWNQIETFAAYGFNKAHAASYGNLAYKTAYMKANYPVEYMTAVLSAEAGDTEKIAEVIAECKRMDIPVLPPDVNESFGDFTVVRKEGEKDSIRFGFYTVKNLGTDISDAIIAERKKGGPFQSFGEFLERIDHKNLNRKSLEALIKSGAMDSFGERGTLIGNIEEAANYHHEHHGACKEQHSIFGLMDDASAPSFHLKEKEQISQEQILMWEKELLGLYISGHPLDAFRARFEERGMNLKEIKEKARDGQRAVIAGIIEDVRPLLTKKGDRMAFIRIADFHDTIEMVVFPKVFVQFKDILEVDTCIACQGKFSERNGEISVIADAVKELKKEKDEKSGIRKEE